MTRTYRCGWRYSIRFTVIVDANGERAIAAKWLPEEPAGRLSNAGHRAYFMALDEFKRAVAAAAASTEMTTH